MVCDRLVSLWILLERQQACESSVFAIDGPLKGIDAKRASDSRSNDRMADREGYFSTRLNGISQTVQFGEKPRDIGL